MGKLKYNIKYLVSRVKLYISPLKYNVLSIEDTLSLLRERKSVLRFGDGEFSLISGENILFEVASKDISKQLVECLQATDNKNLLICLPETLSDLSLFEKRVQKNWVINFADNHKIYKKYCVKNYTYGNAFLSRPYMAYKDKTNAHKCFSELMSLFDNQKVYLIEGKYSRTGVGNDLFEGTKSVSRIICPSKNAFSVIEKIKKSAMSNIPLDALVLIALGPTSKPLGLELIKKGYWVIDIGHIDSEYEWYLRGVKTKVAIENKHTAEGKDTQILTCMDPLYMESIVDVIE